MEQNEKVYLDNFYELISSIKGQRHDFYNHVHVIQYLAQDDNLEELKSYVNTLNKELSKQNHLIKLNHIPLSALLYSKAEVANLNNIEFEFEINDQIPKIEIKSYELIQIVGNLIDNAFDQELKVSKELRRVKFKLETIIDSLLVLQVSNCNSYIEEELLEDIFKEGFTTKNKHNGMGLYTVKQLINRYNGRIDVKSLKENGTTFSVYIPY